MTADEHASIVDWLSEVEGSTAAQPNSLNRITPPPSFRQPSTPPSPSRIESGQSRKRKAHNSGSVLTANKARPARLTRQALASLNCSMAPQNSGENDAQQVVTQDRYRTPSPEKSTSAKASSKTLPTNIQTIRQSLEGLGMRQDDDEAYKQRCPEFKESIDRIFDKDRSSWMTAHSAKEYEKAFKEYYHQNETSLFRKLVPKVIKDGRTVETKKHDAEGAFITMVRSFEDDGLCVLSDRKFAKAMVPGMEYSNEEKPMGIHDPKPDLAFGAFLPKHPLPGLQPDRYLNVLRSVCPGMEWPFFIIENKPSKLGIVEAENQARLDGAVLVNARLQLDAQLHPDGYVRPRGADLNVFFFSAPWVTDSAKIFVHWSEMLEEGLVVFHMNEVKNYYMVRPEEAARFRSDIHTILDWGLLKYVPAARDKFATVMKKTKGKGKVVSVIGALREDAGS